MQGKSSGPAKKRAAVAGLTGLSAAALLAAPESADAATVRACRSVARCACTRAARTCASPSGADARCCALSAPVVHLFFLQELMQLADGRPALFLALFTPVLAWVAYNIGAPALRQIDAMSDKAPAKKKK